MVSPWKICRYAAFATWTAVCLCLAAVAFLVAIKNLSGIGTVLVMLFVFAAWAIPIRVARWLVRLAVASWGRLSGSDGPRTMLRGRRTKAVVRSAIDAAAEAAAETAVKSVLS